MNTFCFFVPISHPLLISSSASDHLQPDPVWHLTADLSIHVKCDLFASAESDLSIDLKCDLLGDADQHFVHKREPGQRLLTCCATKLAVPRWYWSHHYQLRLFTIPSTLQRFYATLDFFLVHSITALALSNSITKNLPYSIISQIFQTEKNLCFVDNGG